MSKQPPYTKDNLDYNKLVKIREEKARQQAQSKNPFLISKPNTDKSLYQGLYTFDVESELAEYTFPMPANLDSKKKGQLQTQTSPQKQSLMHSKQERSKISVSKSVNQNMASYDSPHKESEYDDEKPQDEMDERNAGEGVVERMLRDIYSDKNAKQVNKIQHAFYYTPEVLEHLKTIETGEEAIKFFATYGNSTPIKYINCVRADTQKEEVEDVGPPKPFRPYDLTVLPPKDGDINLAEYYTISAHGIVHVHVDRFRKNQNQASTEFVSLSEWMHESTLFNIITKLPFFSNFIIAKIFNIWKLNVRYRKYNSRRKDLIKKVFYAKPQFADKLLEMNKLMFDFHNTRTINIGQMTKNWDVEDFKTEQKKFRNESKTQYEAVFEKIVMEMETVKKQVHESKNLKLPSELDENKFGKQNRQKPIVQMKKEAAERHQRITLADRDEKLLGNFVRLVDYMMVENLIRVNNNSMSYLIEEMNKERKMGLFLVGVQFIDTNEEVSIINYHPPEEEIHTSMESVLRDMIETVSKVSRIHNHINFESLVREFKEPDISNIIYGSRKYKAVSDQMHFKIKNDFQQAEEHVTENFEKCRDIDQFQKKWSKEEYEKASHSIQKMQEDFEKFQKWTVNITRYITDKAKGIIYINSQRQILKLSPCVKVALETLKDYIYQKMREKSASTLTELRIALEQLQRKPETLAGFASFIENLRRIKEDKKRLDTAAIEVETMHGLLKRFENNPMLTQDTVDLEDLQKDVKELEVWITQAEFTKKERKEEMEAKLKKDTAELQTDITNQASNINSGDLISQDTPIPEALAKLSGIKTLIEKYKARNKTINNQFELITDGESKPNKMLADLEEKFADRNTIWNNLDNFRKQQKEWFTNDLKELDVEEVERYMKTYDRDCKVLKVKLQEVVKEGRDTVLERLTVEVNDVVAKLPIILALGNKDLKERHWKKIFKLIDRHFSPGTGTQLRLKDLLESNITDHKDQVEEIANEAQGQAQILRNIDMISKKWAELAFVVQQYRESKDRFLIGSVDDIIAALDDHQLNIQTMLATRFVAEIRKEVEEWEKKLGLISEVIDEWLTCQRQWMYLENIFNAEDIQKQLPAETAKFKQVDKFWREQMMKTNNKKIVLELCANEELLKRFQANNQILEDIQKGLENYLETKRGAFPRFYFLSDDELLEILSQTRNPHAVQNHLRKCFDNINRIVFTSEEGSKEIVAMISAEPETDPETVPFSASVMAEGPVEHWLYNIQEMMVQTLYDITKKAYYEYPANGLERDEWLFNYPAQVVLLVDIIKWTQGLTDAINDVQNHKNKNAIQDFFTFSKEQIKRMINLVRKNLSTAQRTMMGALIVLDVHARDVVDALTRHNVKDINDFEWTKQLRYYWELDVDNCVVRQTNTRFIYSYEYLGNGPRLVITPLTDKCYMTLTGALHLNYGGAPAGPAGTGKTETTKDLAKALAVQCIVFNCSDNIDYKTMGRFFSGLSQGGAWACFDEFNRIDIEVLSVIAQQILTIQQAIRRKETEFLFEGRVIPLNPRFGVFITMNPGYAGRTELPDNLKALFRPVAMMIPDYALIAEIILFSEGFNDAQNLARKMVQLYKLSSEQLSKQDHYDFGMRAVKSVLVMAGSLRRSEAASLSEDVVLIRAMKNSNEPKFLKDDLTLFRKIIEDLFPQKKIPVTDYGKLREAIEHQLEEKKYQKPELFVDKIIQLMETIKVRHGVMLVGVTGTGKTTVAHTLSKAMGQLNKEGSEDYYHKVVNLSTLNPKSITMNELFGYTNLLTNEWTDGIVAQLVRGAVADKSDSKKWVVFDGPVDAGWIENMNTVLDDNKMLCLPNGERIKLPATFTMMFEVQDLAVASPATVSRCGMVFMETIYLGWQPILDTWIVSFKESLVNKDGTDPKWMKGFLEKLRQLTKECLEYVRAECVEKIASVDSNLVRSTLNIINTMFNLLKEHFGPHTFEKDLGDLPIMILIFSLSWAMGGNAEDETRNKFSNFFKLKIMSLYPNYPYDGEIYDFFVDFDTKTFKHWVSLIGKGVPEYKYNRKTPFFNILVPTGDTVKYKFLIKNLMANGYNVLITGDTGVGKSVIIQEFLLTVNDQRDDEPFVKAALNFSAQTTSNNLMNVFSEKLKKIKRNQLGPPAGKKMFLFIDDVNMPQLDRYGAQPPVELLRQVIDQEGFYDLKKLTFTFIKDTQFICACAPPGGGRNHVTPRLFRHFNMFWMPQLSTKSMEKIFISILDGYLNDSDNKDIQGFAPSIVKASIDIYQRTISKLLPTPAKSHYTFNLRDLSKIIQGILQVNYDYLKTKETLFELWVHETCRVIQDRLVDEKDRGIFSGMIEDNLKQYLDISWTREDFSNFMFGDYLNSAREYQKIDNTDILPKKFNDYLTLYNSSNTKNMDLVFFKDAIDHLSRICRILRQQRGNALLIGVGGSGRQSLTRLAASIRGYQSFSIEITKNYKDPQFKDDLKKVLKIAGAKNNPIVFIFSDTQIVKETFLENINNILNTGEVPNLWAREDLDEITNELRPYAKEKGIPENEIFQTFVALCRENLHIVLTFSPVGNKLRERCLQFPSIINCCTIDWYDKWPEEALYSVALKTYSGQSQLTIEDFDKFVKPLAQLSVEIHTTVVEFSDRFFNELKRKNYTTPTSYLELLKLYIMMLKIQQNIIPMKIKKYTGGLETLKDTNQMVGELQIKIREMQPILDQKAKENAALMIELEGKSAAAKIEEENCLKEASEAQITANEVSELKDSCQKDLNEALPILKKAQSAVMNIEKKDIYELKAMPAPPEMVGIVMNAVCLLIYKDKKKETWEDAKKLMGDMNFLGMLQEYNSDNTPERILERLRKEYLSRPNFNETDMKKVSVACATILSWVVAVDKFAAVKKEVAPKEKRLKEAEVKLAQVQGELAKKQSALKEVQDMVAKLKNNLETSIKNAETLKQKQELAIVQLGRAEKLVSGLGNESKRWTKTVENLRADLHDILGNIMIAAAIIAYLGPFTATYRTEMIQRWIKRCKTPELSIPVSDNFNLQKILADDVIIREWQKYGLPADDLSLDNGIIVSNCKRWPLIIDPQGQANRWIKNFGRDSNIQITKLTENNFMRTLENSIKFGQPVLLENVEEQLDPSLEPILLKQIFQKGTQKMLKLGEQEIPYNEEFRFYITTKMPNPHYLPETSIKVTLINFTVTPMGLEDQLLVEVVKHERIELEEMRDQLIVQISEDKAELQSLEDRILKKIAEVAGNILNDEEIINILEASKITSETINKRMAQAQITAKEINDARENYRSVAKRGSSLYFVIADLARIDPMYQYSLDYFIKIFQLRLKNSEHPPELQARLNVLIDDITKSFYYNICRGLFEKDKLLFSFMIAVKIQMSHNEISSKEWNFFLRGPSIDNSNKSEPPAFLQNPEGLKVWKMIVGLEDSHKNFIGFASSFKDSLQSAIWKQIMEHDDPIDINFPDYYEKTSTPFQKLMIFRVLRLEKVIIAVKKYVKSILGPVFIESPPFNLKAAFEDSTATTPLIFILSPGADPMTALLNLAKEKEMDGPRFKILSLGQGQGQIAAEYIKNARNSGDWVCLQNCHLAATWMTDFERLQEGQVEGEIHEEYRLWLTSMPTPKFPVPVLQSGIKITNEPPKGLKANLRRTFLEVEESLFESSTKPTEFKKLLFSLAFFHAVILERRKFGAIGWNIPYEWMNSDFETCLKQLKMYLDEQPIVPYVTLRFLISEINYGGRVTDDKDVRLITSLLSKYFASEVMSADYKFSPSGIYYAPASGSLAEVRQYIDNLPLEDDPEVFGLHPNANITFQQKTVFEFMETLTSINPKVADKGSGGVSNNDLVLAMAIEIQNQLMDKISFKKVEDLRPLEVFKGQEVDRFNSLVRIIKKSLKDLQNAINGYVVMSLQLEKVYTAFLDKKVPALWADNAYPSLKPLNSWVKDLVLRLEFMQSWVNQEPKSYWVPAFFFPQGFMTSVLQTYARNPENPTPIDVLTFRTEVRKFFKDNVEEVPKDGVNIHGIFIEGCRWDVKRGVLAEAEKGVLIDEMPCIWLEPVRIEKYTNAGTYKSPLYKTSERRGTLSTTGHSTNFVLYLDLKTDQDPIHWVRRGVALLCQKDD